MKQISKPVFLRYGRLRNLLVFVELFDYTVMFFCRLFIGDANQKQIPFVAIVGETEMAEGKVTLKNMQTGEQQQLTPDELLAAVAL